MIDCNHEVAIGSHSMVNSCVQILGSSQSMRENHRSQSLLTALKSKTKFGIVVGCNTNLGVWPKENFWNSKANFSANHLIDILKKHVGTI